MKLGLILLLVACFSCLVIPTWGTGILAAKKLAAIGAAKGVALSALAAKGALLKGLVHKKLSGGKPMIIIQKPSQSKPGQSNYKPLFEIYKPLLEVDTNLYSTIPKFRPKLYEFDTPMAVEELSTMEVKKPRPIEKHPKVLEKMSGLLDMITGAMQFKSNAVASFFESIEPQEQPVIYQIVRSANPVPVEDEILIGK